MLSEKIIRLLKKSGWILVLIIAFVLGVKQLREPDIWWMLRTGEWILQNGKVMKQDIFSYTFEGVEWLNVKWGFEIILLWFSRIGGPEFTLLLQSIANVLLLVFVYKLYDLLRKADVLPKKRYLPKFSIIFCAYILLFVCEFRLNGRPEKVSHVMTAVYLFILLSWRFFPSKMIFLLIPLQILWTNLHEAYGTGTVIMLAMLGATWFEYLFIYKDKSNLKNGVYEMPLQLTIAVLLAVAASAIHPWGLRMITHPFEIFTQVQENKFTSELLSFTDKGYWQKEAYWNIFIFIFGIISFLFRFSVPVAKPKNAVKKVKPKWYLRPLGRFGLGYIGLYFMFFYLSLTAYRNIPFFIIVAIPIVAIGIDNFTRFLAYKLEKKGKLNIAAKGKSIAYISLLVIGIASYFLVVSGFFYNKIDDGRDKYGLQVNPLMHPIGAAYFVADNNINGKCFSDFLVSNFLLWQLRPDFKTYIDLRDLDVFPADFFNEFAQLVAMPAKFDEMDKKHGFNYAVLNRANFQPLHKFLYEHPQWILAYADPVSALYLKNSVANRPVINKLKLYEEKADVFSAPMEWQDSKTSILVSKIFRPGFDPGKKDAVNYDLIASDFYKSIGKLDVALARALKASAKNKFEHWKGMEKTGDVYVEMAQTDTSLTTKTQKLSMAEDAYNKALLANKNSEMALIGLGIIKMNKKEWQQATNYFENALEINYNNVNTHLYLAQVQSNLVQVYPDLSNAYMKTRIKHLENAYKLDKSNYYIRFHLGIATCQLGNCKDCKNYLEDIINFPGVSEQERDMAKQLLIRCGG